ncbi:MAG TPA: choice-of-anchor Q domain-containing protein [bacterium]|nr:choice-of-anchor Q domain-containing protein [bacterium]
MKSSIVGALLGATALLGISPAGATTFTVNVFDDPVPVAAPNGCTGQGSNPTRCSLREAVLSANANADTDEIVLSEGTYQLAQTGDDDTAEDGDLDFTQGGSEVTVVGLGSDKTVIDAALINERIFTYAVSSMSLSVEGMTLRNGNAGTENGGAIGMPVVGGIELNLADCRFENNRAAQGGAVEVKNSSTATFSDITFSGNEATTVSVQDGGGALRVGESSTLSWTNGTVSGNQSASAGGGIFYVNGANVTMSNIEIFDNEAAAEGGGIFTRGGAELDFAQGRVVDNRAGQGGGIYTHQGSAGEVNVYSQLTISNNQASGDGGGIWTGSSLELQLDDSTVSGNTSGGEGGGFFAMFSPIVALNNSTISGNSATGGGGAVSGESGAIFNFRNATIFSNTAQAATGGILSSDVGLTVTIANSVLAGNTFNGAFSDCDGVPVGSGLTFTSGNYNLFGEIGDCAVTTLSNDQTGVNDPGLKELADNGGPTQTHMLEADSPALDGGNPAGCLGTDGATLTTDQRGFVRPSGPECDIGAVEAALTDLAIVKTSDDEVYVVGDEITYTLTVINNGPSISPAIASDILPGEVSFVSADAGCSESGGAVTCDLGSLDPGESAAVNIVVEANSDGTVENTATVSGADVDTDPSNDSSSVTVNVIRNDTDGGGCRIGQSPSRGAPLGWGLLGIGLLAAGSLGRRRLN